MTSWPALVTDHLLGSKCRGLPWHEAKRQATLAHPPRGRDAAATTLFDESGRAHETAVSFYWRHAELAYRDMFGAEGSGFGPDIAKFVPGMLRDLDSSVPARRRRRVAA